MQEYAEEQKLPVRTNCKVVEVTKSAMPGDTAGEGRFRVLTEDGAQLRCTVLICCTGFFSKVRVAG